MLRSGLFGFGLLAAAGSVSLAGCTSDSAASNGTENDAAAGASGSGGASGTGGAATGGAATGGAATGGAATGGASTGGASTGGSDASTGGSDASTGGSDASTADGASTGGATSDASTDGTTGADGTTGDASSVLTCGSSPYARLWVGGGTLLDHPTSAISVSGSACPGTTLSLTPNTPASSPGQTGIDAQFLDVPDKAAIHLRATQTGSFPLLTQEVLPDKDSIVAQAFGFAATVGIYMIATDSGFDALDPSWNASTRAILLLQIAPLQGAAGNCADTTGITVTVDGHAEATGLNGVTPILTTAGTNGTYVFVTTTGTPTAAELLTLTVSKTGCTVSTTGYEASPGLQTSLTGKYPVEAGAVTWGLAAITN